MADVAEQRRGREGGRWVNERPTSKEFADWFETSMKIDSALNIADYIGGVVLIPAVDNKAKFVAGWTTDGKPIIDERPELSYVPYAKVETRTNYYWDLLAAHEDWVGVLTKVTPPRLPIEEAIIRETTDGEGGTVTEYAKAGGLATMVYQLPEGFSVMSVPVADGYSHFLLCTVRAAIYRADEDGNPKGAPLRSGTATKQVPLTKPGWNNRPPYADDSSLMKAETGAQGRALGFAGIFVIPGSGVATAEDMMEAAAQGETPVQTATAAVPDAAGPDAPAQAPIRTGAELSEDEETTLKKRAVDLYVALKEKDPTRADAFTDWAHNDRKLAKLSDAKGAMLRGVVRKLERLTEEAETQPAEVADVSTSEEAKADDAE